VEDDLKDVNPALRAYGVRRLMSWIQTGSKSTPPADIFSLYTCLMNLLDDTESYVYLAVIHTLALLLLHHKQIILSKILIDFSGQHIKDQYITSNLHDSKNKSKLPIHSYRKRALLGEAMSLWLRTSGGVTSSYCSVVIRACVSVARGRPVLLHTVRPRIQDLSNNSVATSCTDESKVNIDLKNMRVSLNSVETDTDTEREREIHTERETETERRMHSSEMNEVINSADEVLLRQSALSLLADALVAAQWSVRPLLGDVIEVATCVLLMENRGKQENRAAMRSAAFILRQLVCEVGDMLLTIPEGLEHLQIVMRCLRRVIAVTPGSRSVSTHLSPDARLEHFSCHDQVVIHHAEIALASLDDIVTRSLSFPNESLLFDN